MATNVMTSLLTDDCWQHMLSFCNLEQVDSFRQTCGYFHDLTKQDCVWESFCSRYALPGKRDSFRETMSAYDLRHLKGTWVYNGTHAGQLVFDYHDDHLLPYNARRLNELTEPDVVLRKELKVRCEGDYLMDFIPDLDRNLLGGQLWQIPVAGLQRPSWPLLWCYHSDTEGNCTVLCRSKAFSAHLCDVLLKHGLNRRTTAMPDLLAFVQADSPLMAALATAAQSFLTEHGEPRCHNDE
eukprot:TRINITY_DN14745_c0_g1_i1.p1 TRINITY_DN14745_c0_g1~~TRINITY_DN14745_c0_g1_i1.p1  ORF type:complete len:239 (-),score=28.02 TRINITY_DN14745_c0_g1_i1:46-762(-)